MRDRVNNNCGYTLVELIIVIAIITIMSGMGALTIGAIRTSQATASQQRFDEEISSLLMRTKSQVKDYAIKIEKVDDNYNIYYGTCKGDDKATLNESNFVANSSEPDAVLNRVTIYYDEDYDADDSTTPLVSKVIKVRKSDGQILSGYGEYRFCKHNSDATVGRVTLNEYTGGHTYGSD